ncbi:P1 family peptidase [Acetobacter sacchari]|uniref:P1 family peptidase n=1 Tax=Acetobacter sacchari TaxID=2661687 RepID=A0ABS3LRX5_9PROT|nr:P1 family peptidase [Acetobacter sacchari]MBO1358663.1 P1 family peptidase [Acetobacter sacchari]
MPSRPRARELALPLPGAPGPLNAITDVPGVRVGYKTLISGEGEHAIRTGVTAILPRAEDDLLHPVLAGSFSMNGNGELTGCHWIDEAGWFMGPITLTNTCSLGIAHHATARWMLKTFPDVMGETLWPLPVVGETFDGWLNDIAGQHVTEADVLAAIEAAAASPDFAPVAEGNVGGGTGMIAYEFKGGTGTSSRIVRTKAGEYTLGALVQANHGRRSWLTVCGAAAGRAMPEDALWPSERGSIIVILATDAPLESTQLRRVAKRIGIGIGRGGTPSGNNSGDIFLAFSTANDPGVFPGAPLRRIEALSDEAMDDVFMAAVEVVEEAVLNAMLGAETMVGRRGRLVRAIDPERLKSLVCAPPGGAA